MGGRWGDAELLEAIADPDHEMHEDYTAWVDHDFDPEEFERGMVNNRLKRLKS